MITVISTTKSLTFGGYAAISWNSPTTSYWADDSQQCFVFMIMNQHGIGCREFRLNRDRGQRAIAGDSGFEPVFEYGHNIRVYHN
jgi:hypothetical protein